MNKEKRIKNLAWEFFWEQKEEEIYDHFEDNLYMYIPCSIFFGLFFQVGWLTKDNGEMMSVTLGMIGISLILFWIFMGIIMLIRKIINWIRGNWEKAKNKAVKKEKEESK